MIEGYKKTPIGLLPLEWKVCILGEIGEFKNGINKGKEDFGHGFPMVNLNDVFGVSTVKNENLGLVNSTINERKDYFLAKGDVLFIRSSVKPSGVGLTAVIPYDLIDTVYSGFIIRFRDKGILDVNFKKHCFYEIGFRNRLLAKSSVSANTNINQKSLNSLSIAVPPLPEQQKIADILSTVDDKIEAINQKIIETQALKKGLMQRLLTKGIGHTEFKDSPLGMIPESWDIKILKEECVKLNVGFVGTCEKFYCEKNEGVLMIRTGNLSDGKIKYSNLKYVTPEFHNINAKSKISEGDLLIARHGSSGQAVLVPKNFEESNCLNIIIIRPKATLNPDFLKFQFNSNVIKEQVRKKTAGSTQGVVNTKEIATLIILYPPLSEQNKIANILNSIDDKLEVLTEKKTHYQELKQGLMLQLLTGKIRVKV